MMKKYSIGEVSKLLQIPKSRLRYWDSEDLIQLARNEENDYREYTLRELLTIIDLTLYRSLNMPIKRLKEMYQWDIDSWEEILSCEIEIIDDKMKNLQAIKKEIHDRKEKVQQVARSQNKVFTKSQPDLQKVIVFDLDDKDTWAAFRENSYDFVVYLPKQTNEIIIEPFWGLSVDELFPTSTIIWERAKDEKTYMECLLKIGREAPHKNNMTEITKAMEEQGYKTGAIIGRYLTTAKETISYDFYKAWIEISEF